MVMISLLSELDFESKSYSLLIHSLKDDDPIEHNQSQTNI